MVHVDTTSWPSWTVSRHARPISWWYHAAAWYREDLAGTRVLTSGRSVMTWHGPSTLEHMPATAFNMLLCDGEVAFRQSSTSTSSHPPYGGTVDDRTRHERTGRSLLDRDAHANQDPSRQRGD